MKRKIIAMITAIAAASAMFTVYAAAPSDKLVEQGILSGYEDGELHLERTLTRAEFTKIFCDAFLKDGIKNGHEMKDFPDINGHWAKDYITKAVAAGVIAGFEDGTFKPDETVTYEQAVKMIVAYLESDSYSAEKKYPEGYIGAALDMGISDGVTKLIGETITREDVVYLVDNALTKIEADKQAEDEEDAYWNSFTTSYSNSAGGGGGAAIAPKNRTGVISSGAASFSVDTAAEDSGAIEVSEAGLAAPEPYDYDYNGYFNTEEYDSESENVFKNALTSPLSTFSIDADTASYSNMRRFVLGYATFPTKGSIRTEELINYFNYDNP
ncbi:MAG: von Willebrand factor type A domain-containing protein, partial [Clostridia bacterium]|nr:von Willebrand factor type A domain-containing protein [Clostridia bacterium]